MKTVSCCAKTITEGSQVNSAGGPCATPTFNMPKITNVKDMPDKERVYVYIDGAYCCSIRARTWCGMGLKVGDQITCEELQEREKFHWKKAYGEAAWEKEKVRLTAVKALIESISPQVSVHVTGFGAGTTGFIGHHPKEAGKPDIEVSLKETGMVLLFIEVTGTERMRGTSYWVRPDKLDYAKHHPSEDVWVVLHFVEPEEKFVFIKPDLTVSYVIVTKEIRGSIEKYVEFNDGDVEVVKFQDFKDHLLRKLPGV